MATARVILVRHGTTAFNADTPGPERLRGWVDVPLVEKGVQQGKAIAAVLARFPAKRLFASDLSRATDTGKLVQAAQPDPKPALMPTYELRPWNIGAWAGQEVPKVLEQMRQHMFVIPETPVPDGESFNAFTSRFLCFLRVCMSAAAIGQYTIICTTHTRNLRTADGWWHAGMPEDLRVDKSIIWNPKHVEPGGALLFTLQGNNWVRDTYELDKSSHSSMAAS